MSPVSSTACICKGQIRDWSHQGQNSPLCSPPIHHSLICNIVNELMCLADFINIHLHEIMKVSLEVELGVLRNCPKQFVNSVEVTSAFVLQREQRAKQQVMFFRVIALEKTDGSID